MSHHRIRGCYSKQIQEFSAFTGSLATGMYKGINTRVHYIIYLLYRLLSEIKEFLLPWKNHISTTCQDIDFIFSVKSDDINSLC